MSSYGSTETGYVLTQCEAGHFHQNIESCRIDFQPLKAARGDTAIGRILVTPFGHPWFSLIRFDIADSVRFQRNFQCPCGRNAEFTFTNLEGRIRDITLTPAGRVVTVNALDTVLSAVNGLLAYQLQQMSPTGYRLRAAASDGDQAEITSALTDALRRLYGIEAEIEIQLEPDFSPEPSGKYRLAKPMISIDSNRLFHPDGEIQ